ncbi:MAG: condensation domain-containing protein, partial [Planctomycetota bacterium]
MTIPSHAHGPGLRLKPSCITELLRQRADRFPEKIAFRFLSFGEAGEEALTYGELDRRARAIAARLQAMDAPGARVLVLQPPGLEYIAALYGCLQAGAVAVPAFPPGSSRRGARLETLAADSGATLALTSAEILLGLGPALKGGSGLGSLRWLASEDLVVDSDPDDWQETPFDPDSLALLQFTSGSTSAPRGVMLSHGNILANCAAISELLEAGSDSRGVSWLPPYHDMGLIGMLLQPVFSGGEVILMSPLSFLRNPVRWLQAVSDFRAEVSAGPNFAYDLCVRRITDEQKAKLDLRSWRIAFNGAERVRPGTLERFAAAFAPCGFAKPALRPCYGLAEATLCVTARRTGPVPHRHAEGSQAVVGYGPPVEGTEVRIVDPETRQPCPPGGVGEIWVAGGSVAQGYWNNPRLTGETFQGRIAGEEERLFLRTGDLGFLDEGELFVTGRIKDLIILSGKNHHPEDVEFAVQGAHPLLRPDACIAFSVDVDGQEQLVLAQEVSRAGGGEKEEIAAAIRERAAGELELQVHTVALLRPGGLPRTTSGKLQRRLCRSRFLDGTLATLACLGPEEEALSLEGAPVASSALEETILATMREVLQSEDVGIHDNFFDLGGQSLLATGLLSRLREAFRIDLPLRLIFEAPTAAALAWRIGELALEKLEVPPIVPVDRKGLLPLSFSQERMWFLHQLDPQNTAYNVAGGLSLEGLLDVGVLEKALGELLQRHEILRTAYETRKGRPFPVIHAACELPLVRADLRSFPDPEAEAGKRASRLAGEPFDLAAAPLLRVQLYRVGAKRLFLSVCMHHIVADGWSAGLLMREMLALYDAFSSGRPSPLAPVAIGYADYAAWQRRWLSGKVLERQLAYWRSRLADLPDLLALPTDRPRPRQLSTRGARIHFDLSEELLGRLREFGLRHDATLFMVLLGAFQTLLARYSGMTDVPVGVPIANRNWPASEALVGTLVNTLVLRADLSGGPGFGEVLGRVRETALSAYANQDLPFEQLVEALHPQRSLRHAPLFQVLFDYQSIPIPVEEAAGIRVRPRLVAARRRPGGR